MPGSSNGSSFIPKRGPVTRKTKNPTHRIYIFSLVSYIMMFSALLASGAVFLYGQYIDKLFTAEVEAFNSEIQSFEEPQMIKITEFDNRLKSAASVFNSSFSTASIFDAMEKATAKTVEFESFDIEIEEDFMLVEAKLITDSFDSVIFQREFYNSSGLFASISISDVTPSKPSGGELEEGSGSTNQGDLSEDVFGFSLKLEIPLSEIPLKEVEELMVDEYELVIEPTASVEEDIVLTEVAEDVEVNQNDEGDSLGGDNETSL